MTRSTADLRLMAVHAHPDDESSKGAATMAQYVAEGVQVMVVTCTGGEAGGVLNPAMDRPEVHADLACIRRREMAAAARILGVRHRWLGFVDSGWPGGDPPPPLPPGSFAALPLEVATAALVGVVREFRPHVVVTYDEIGGYPHPDHIRCHQIAVAAFDAARDPDRFPDQGRPWQPSKLYYVHEWCGERMRQFHRSLLAAGMPSPYHDWLEEWTAQRDVRNRLTTRVECGAFFARRDEALRAHATQIAPESHWFAVPLTTQRELWPTEDFELVQSRVPVRTPEDDLFAGLRGDGAGADGAGADGAGTRAGPPEPAKSVTRPVPVLSDSDTSTSGKTTVCGKDAGSSSAHSAA